MQKRIEHEHKTRAREQKELLEQKKQIHYERDITLA